MGKWTIYMAFLSSITTSNFYARFRFAIEIQKVKTSDIVNCLLL